MIEQRDKIFVIHLLTGGTATARPYVKHKTGRYDSTLEEADDRPVAGMDYDAATEGWIAVDTFPESSDVARTNWTSSPQEPVYTVDTVALAVNVAFPNAAVGVRQREVRRVLERRRKRAMLRLGLESKVSSASWASLRTLIDRVDDVEANPNWAANPEGILGDANYNEPAITLSSTPIKDRLAEILAAGTLKYDDYADISNTAAGISSQTTDPTAATGLANIVVSGGVSTDLVFIDAITNIDSAAAGDQVRLNAWITVQIGAGSEFAVGNAYVLNWGFTGGGQKQLVLMGCVTANTIANLTFRFRVAKAATHSPAGNNPLRTGGLLRARRVSGG